MTIQELFKDQRLNVSAIARDIGMNESILRSYSKETDPLIQFTGAIHLLPFSNPPIAAIENPPEFQYIL